MIIRVKISEIIERKTYVELCLSIGTIQIPKNHSFKQNEIITVQIKKVKK